MSIQELLPIARALTGDEKRWLREWLEAELSNEPDSAEKMLPPGDYRLTSPEPVYDAPHTLNVFLEAERGNGKS